MAIREISRERFEALVAYTRSPAAAYVSRELEWFSDNDERVLGVLLLDTIDNDFAYVVLGRDEHRRFRAIEEGASLESIEIAREKLHREIEKQSATGNAIFPQGDGEKEPIDLFKPTRPTHELNPGFVKLLTSEGFSPARGIIDEIMPAFVDIDGNFVDQFQTVGFDSRIWELYLFAYIHEEQLFLDRGFHAPDFVVAKYGKTVCVEAVTVNPTAGAQQEREVENVGSPQSPEEIRELLNGYMPIKWGSPLYSKLQKRYWALPHVTGKPLVLAIADFHDSMSMLWSSTALFEYLYGVRHDFHLDENGQLIISPLPIDVHSHGEKKIPSGFFLQPDANNISAVLFSSSATISKFNRMGKLAGFGSREVKMIRWGFCYKHDPNSALPGTFVVEVDPRNYHETWGEGLSMFHNPNALYPVPEELFSSIAHHKFKNGQIVSHIPEFHPFASVTLIGTEKKEDENKREN